MPGNTLRGPASAIATELEADAGTDDLLAEEQPRETSSSCSATSTESSASLC